MTKLKTKVSKENPPSVEVVQRLVGVQPKARYQQKLSKEELKPCEPLKSANAKVDKPKPEVEKKKSWWSIF